MTKFNAKEYLKELGADEDLIDDWFLVRKTKKATNTKTAMKRFIMQVERSNYRLNEILEICCEKSWSGFNHEWIKEWKKDDLSIVAGVFE